VLTVIGVKYVNFPLYSTVNFMTKTHGSKIGTTSVTSFVTLTTSTINLVAEILCAAVALFAMAL